jgi:hypothetical protein
LDQTEFHGESDASACAFSRFSWDFEGTTATVAPDSEIHLQVMFTPPDVGEYRAFLKIYSNAIDNNPLYIFLCGQALESDCSVHVDGSCQECVVCNGDIFEQMIANEDNLNPTCSEYD